MKQHRVFQIFKAGSQVATGGIVHHFSEKDLEHIATAYKIKPDAPLVIGHPRDNKPEYGRVLGLFARGDKLYAQAEVNPELIQLVRSGSYKKVSASFYSLGDKNNPYPCNYFLRHVGFLGAQPPAVKGMDALKFSEINKDAGVCFSESYDCRLFSFNNQIDLSSSSQLLHEQVLHYQEVCPDLCYEEALNIVLAFEY